MNVDTMQHQDIVEALTVIERNLADARANGKFMVAVWWVEGEEVSTRSTRWNFPSGDPIHKAIAQLQVQLLGTPEEKLEPLPVADFVATTLANMDATIPVDMGPAPDIYGDMNKYGPKNDQKIKSDLAAYESCQDDQEKTG